MNFQDYSNWDTPNNEPQIFYTAVLSDEQIDKTRQFLLGNLSDVNSIARQLSTGRSQVNLLLEELETSLSLPKEDRSFSPLMISVAGLMKDSLITLQRLSEYRSIQIRCKPQDIRERSKVIYWDEDIKPEGDFVDEKGNEGVFYILDEEAINMLEDGLPSRELGMRLSSLFNNLNEKMQDYQTGRKITENEEWQKAMFIINNYSNFLIDLFPPDLVRLK